MSNTSASNFYIYTDGGARGNPGPAAVGVVIRDSKGNLIAQFGKAIGRATNNIAEYTAVIEALRYVAYHIGEDTLPGTIHCFLDSELVVSQLKGVYRVKAKHLFPLYHLVQELLGKLRSRDIVVSFFHIHRRENASADRLVNETLDRKEPV